MKRTVPLVVAAILLLSACSDPAGGGSVSSDDSPTEVAAEPNVKEPEKTEPDTTPVVDEATPIAPAEEPSAGGGPDCIAGVWEMDVTTFETALQGIVDTPGETTIEGDLAVQFTPTGEYTQFKNEFTILTTVGGQTVRSVTTGALTGSYLVEGDIVHLFDAFDIYHESYMEMPGIGRVDIATGEDAEFDVFGFQYTAPSDANFGTYNGAGKFTCTDAGITIEVEGKSVDWVPGSVPDMTGWK